MTFLTREDYYMAFNLFCCVFGIGSLGIPANFSRAGPYIGTLALIFMAFANVYATVVVSKVMLVAPPSVRTFGDVGEWSMGKTGRWLVLIAQMGVCILMPCAFFVLGGMLLEMVFPGSFDDVTWIILMAISLAPISLIPTLKEGAGAAFAGSLGTIIADFVGVGVLLHGMKGHPTVPVPKFSLDEIATTFGNLALAYGAAIVIPSLQREHSQPERMPRVIIVTLVFVSILFLIMGLAGYSALGCQIEGNLLFSIYANPQNPITNLGFKPHFGMIVIAFLSMQLHMVIAFSVLLSPVYYLIERVFLGMHQFHSVEDLEGQRDFQELKSSLSKTSIALMAEKEELEQDEYKKNAYKWIPIRMFLIVCLTFISVLLKDKFLELCDFAGASACAVSCLILPLIFYMKVMWKQLPFYEKVGSMFILVVCTLLALYVTFTSGKQLFLRTHIDPTAPTYKFCEGEFAYKLYYNATQVAEQAKKVLL